MSLCSQKSVYKKFVGILVKRVQGNFTKTHSKTTALESLFVNVTGLKPAASLKMIVQHKCFLYILRIFSG